MPISRARRPTLGPMLLAVAALLAGALLVSMRETRAEATSHAGCSPLLSFVAGEPVPA